MITRCVVCGRETELPDDWRWEHLCRKCVKEERAERKKFSKYFLKREMKRDYR